MQRRPERITDAQGVLSVLDDPATRVINALSREQFLGIGGAHYGRPGCIPNSVSAPARDMIDPLTNRLLPDDVLRAQLQAAGVWQADRAITYCGGGIAASITAFVLEMLGDSAMVAVRQFAARMVGQSRAAHRTARRSLNTRLRRVPWTRRGPTGIRPFSVSHSKARP